MKIKLKDAIKLANKANDAGLITDRATGFKAVIDSNTGFLTAPVTLARTGVQIYYGYELGLKDRALEKIGVFRPPEEVFHPDSLDSYKNLTVTDDHPENTIDIGNVKGLQKGSLSDTKQKDQAHISGIITVTDSNMISKIKSGKKEVSVGYFRDLIEESGEYQGVNYDFVMRNIRANHVAIVDAGRCGAACKLTLDKKEFNMKVLIGGISFDIKDEQLAQAILNSQKDAEEKEKENKEKMKEKDQEIEKKEKEKKEAEAGKDAAEAERDVIRDGKLSEDDLNKVIFETADLISDARAILGEDKLPECGNCPVEIRAAVVDHLTPDVKTEGKSKEYIFAAYDMAMIGYKKGTDSTLSLRRDFGKDKENIQGDRASARNGYMKDQLGLPEEE
ncbi:MAG: DUF2213 domain-containing protein [bacterium]|nr:DUF2213 domain-containing protein [bacterium]